MDEPTKQPAEEAETGQEKPTQFLNRIHAACTATCLTIILAIVSMGDLTTLDYWALSFFSIGLAINIMMIFALAILPNDVAKPNERTDIHANLTTAATLPVLFGFCFFLYEIEPWLIIPLSIGVGLGGLFNRAILKSYNVEL